MPLTPLGQKNKKLLNRADYESQPDEEVLSLSLRFPSVFEILIKRYETQFLRAAYKVVRHKEEAEDVVQATFTKIYFKAGSFKKMEGATFKSWAYKILLNTALNHYKKMKKNFERFEYLTATSENYTAEENSARAMELKADLKNAVADVILKLPQNLASALKKFYLEDKTHRKIADEEGVSVNAVKLRIFRAKKNFRKIAENENWRLTDWGLTARV